MTSGRLNADVDRYLQAATMNTPPPQIVSDPLVAGVTPVEQLLRVLGLAANLGDPQDNAMSAEQHAERDRKAREAAEKFAAQDDAAADELHGITVDPSVVSDPAVSGPDPAAAMAQQLPQLAAGIAGALAGAVGGALQPLAQLPQQTAQGIQQALQTGMGLFQQSAGDATAPIDDAFLADDPLTEDFGAEPADIPDLGAGGGAGGGSDLGAAGGGLAAPGATAPTAYLGPPPVPSAGTAPSSAPITPMAAPGPGPAATPAAAGMAGMPMVPPGGMGTPANTDKDAKAETKRVAAPQVRNGAPVQGRLTVPPATPTAAKKVDGRPVVTRRVIAPNDAQTGGNSES